MSLSFGPGGKAQVGAIMKKLVLIGGIASGKSTVGRELESLGARRIDMDQVSRDVCAPRSEVVRRIAERFGPDVVDEGTGELRRGLLAGRAFASPSATADLEAITHPAITRRLIELVGELEGSDELPAACVIEIPLPDRVPDVLSWADDVICVSCPLSVRRARAVLRGMDPADFDRRAALQPTDDEFARMATVDIHNDGDKAELLAQVRLWWETMGIADKA